VYNGTFVVGLILREKLSKYRWVNIFFTYLHNRTVLNLSRTLFVHTQGCRRQNSLESEQNLCEYFFTCPKLTDWQHERRQQRAGRGRGPSWVFIRGTDIADRGLIVLFFGLFLRPPEKGLIVLFFALSLLFFGLFLLANP